MRKGVIREQTLIFFSTLLTKDRGRGNMRKITTIMFVLLFGICMVSSVFGDSASKEECVTMCKKAAEMINERGLEAATAELNNKEGKFVSENTYVFLMELDGDVVAHPLSQKRVGKNLLGYKDTEGKLFVQEFIEVAKTKGEGWVDYMFPKPEEYKKPEEERISSKKTSFVYRVPGTDLVAIAGIFE
jgi:hypothetical protein